MDDTFSSFMAHGSDETTSDRTRIKDWSANDRPREKLLSNGKTALSDAELLAIIIGSGNRQETAVALMQRLLKDVDHNLNQLGIKTVEELMRYKGIGEAKAISIVAMLELGRRRQSESIPERHKIESSVDSYKLIVTELMDLHHEEFWILMLNNSNRLIKKERISNGGMGNVIVDPKILFKKAIDNRAAGLILAHNHPSGNPIPSTQDERLTSQLVAAGHLLEIKVHDHLIIADDQYYSFADEGLM